MKRIRQGLPIALAALAFSPVVPLPVAKGVPLYQEEANQFNEDRMAVFQYAAQHGDKSHEAEMIALLKQPQTPDYSLTLAYSLSCLGDVDALPAIDQVIAWWKIKGNWFVGRMPIIRARLVAEAAGNKVSDPVKRAQVKVQTFLKEVGLTASDINTQVADYNAKVAQVRETPAVDFTLPGQPPGYLACAELADIVYQSDDYPSYASVRICFT